MMIVVILIQVLLVAPVTSNIQNRSCNELPDSYRDRSEAENAILSAEGWKIREYDPTTNSSWMKGARYLSCDGELGYLFFHRDFGSTTIHEGVEARVWRQFTATDNKDKFYSRNFRGRYEFRVYK